jgi:hypothetical protein
LESYLLQKLADRKISKQDVYQAVAANFELLPEIFEGLSASKASVRYGCGSVLVELSVKYPEKLYQNFDSLVQLLDCKYRILTWNAMVAIANLCRVDKNKKFDAIFDKYYSFLNNEYLVTVANIVVNSPKIAAAKPYLISRITTELLNVECIRTTPHLTEECKRVLAEHALEAFSQMYGYMGTGDKAKLLAFVKRQIGSSRINLNKKAELFLKNRAQ